jgi:hypothetical protein
MFGKTKVRAQSGLDSSSKGERAQHSCVGDLKHWFSIAVDQMAMAFVDKSVALGKNQAVKNMGFHDVFWKTRLLHWELKAPKD